jgi:hypothetical protein
MASLPESVEGRLALASAEYANSVRHLLPSAESLGLVGESDGPLYERVLHIVLDDAPWDWRLLRDLAELTTKDWRDILAAAKENRRPAARWAWSDAWIYTAIRISDRGEGVTLSDLMTAADVVNHAYPTDAEITQAVRRLIGAGLVDVRDGRFQLTAAGASLNPRRLGGLFGQIDSYLKELRRLPVTETDWSLPPNRAE